jgi:hypothetical protein
MDLIWLPQASVEGEKNEKMTKKLLYGESERV